jgi:hypothetical protein
MANGHDSFDDLDARFGPPMSINILDIGLPGVRPPAHIQREVINDILTQLEVHVPRALETPGMQGVLDAHRLMLRSHQLLIQYAMGHPEFDEPGFDMFWPIIEVDRKWFRRRTRFYRRVAIRAYLKAPEEKLAEYREMIRKIESNPNFDNFDRAELEEDHAAAKAAIAGSAKLGDGLLN